MALPENQGLIQSIIKELEPLIIGVEHEGYKMGSTASQHRMCRPGTARSIIPGGETYPGQEIHWYMWQVAIEPLDPSDRPYSCGLNHFIHTDDIKSIFARCGLVPMNN